MATVLYYLNDVEEGGETCFPRAGNRYFDYDYSLCQGLRMTPKKGRAVLFYNLHPNGTTDITSLHIGSDVIKGEKWLVNI